MESGNATGFDNWLRDHLHEKRWKVMDLARIMAKNEGIVPEEIETRARAISSNISKARLGKGALGDEYARKIAEALEADEVSLFRAAGLLSNKPNIPTESDARRKINALIDMLSREEQEQAIAILETFRKKRQEEINAAQQRKLKRS